MNQQPSEYLVLIFNVGAYTFCVPALEVESVIKKPGTAITPVPGSPNAVAGILAHRGQIVTVISLHRKLGLIVSRETASGLLIISRMDYGLTAFRVDGVSDVISAADVRWHPVTVNTSFTAVDKLGIHEKLLLMHTHLDALAKMEDCPPQDSQFLKLAEALGFRSSAETETQTETTPETVPETVRLYECNDAEYPDQNGLKEEACKAEKIENIPPAPRADTPPQKAGGLHKPVPKVITGKPSTIYQRSTSRVSIAKIKATPKPAIPSKDRPAQIRETARPAATGMAGIVLDKASTAPADVLGDARHHKEQSPVETLSIAGSRTGRTKFLWIAAGIIAAALFLAFLIRPWHHYHKTEDIALPDENIALPTTVSTSVAEVPEKEEPSEAVSPPLSVSEKRAAEPIVQSVDTAPATPAGEKMAENAEAVEAPAASDSENSRTPQELLRVETTDFTLTVERPQTDSSIPPQPGQAPEVKQIIADEMLVHNVVQGDTLWDIAESYLGNPLLYPELAKISHIKDPNWIYPGDVIRIIHRH